jgi:hypothetical protein
MKYQKILGIVATAGLLLAGCATDSDNNNTWLSDSNAVHVSASVGSIFTRSNPTDEAKQTSFNKDDVMGVSNNGKSLNYTFNGTDWQPGDGSYLVWDKNDLNFQCWYPADGKNTFSKGYVQEDQSKTTEIAKSDYMTAAVTNLTEIPGDRQLKVALERKTARLIFNIQSFNDQFDASTKVNHIRMASKASTDASESSIVNIKPLQNGEGGIGTTYTALVMPGAVDGHLYFKAEGTTETPLVVKTGDLKAGMSYTYNLIVGKNKIAINDITVKDWATGEITGGKAEEAIPYVTFTAEGEQTFMMSTSRIDPEFMPGIEPYKISELQYSLNNGDWKDVEETGIRVAFGGNNGTLRLRGKNLKGTAEDYTKYSYISFGNNKVPVTCTGDIRTLLDHESYKTVATDQARFYYLFQNCKALTSAPDLPAEALADNCYQSMFRDCTNLVNAPALPAETLNESCYENMFGGCTNLKKAPELPATKLADYCYRFMFYNCKSLDTAPTLSVEDLANSCYSNMFKGCTSLKTAPVLPAKSLKSYCYSNMFSECTSLENAPALLATVLAESCYSNMFENCTSLESAPELPATKLAENCYEEMFKGCKKLSSVTMLAPSNQIEDIFYSFNSWLNDAGTSAATRTLKVTDADAYNALAKNTYYLPSNSIWKKGTAGTTVKDKNNKDIQ